MVYLIWSLYWGSIGVLMLSTMAGVSYLTSLQKLWPKQATAATRRKYGKTRIVICQDAANLGRQAAEAVADTLRRLLDKQDEVRVVFAAGESQTTFLQALARQEGIDWQRVVCFNMDDFWDPRMDAKYTCGHQTRTQLYEKVHPKAFHLIRHDAPDAQSEASRFAELLRDAGPIDVLCQGIGTSGHLALCEPGAADFDDPATVKVVELVAQSKRQLIEDPNFRDLGYIPEKGITMTIPAMMSAGHIFTMVPLALKRDILTKLILTPEPTPHLPASILSTVESTLFVDRDSCPDSLLT